MATRQQIRQRARSVDKVITKAEVAELLFSYTQELDRQLGARLLNMLSDIEAIKRLLAKRGVTEEQYQTEKQAIVEEWTAVASQEVDES